MGMRLLDRTGAVGVDCCVQLRDFPYKNVIDNLTYVAIVLTNTKAIRLY
jgi:hypothetical protein